MSSSTSRVPHAVDPMTNDGHLDVAVLNGGAVLKIQFASGVISNYDAIWLWNNDTTYIHPPSGQRTRSPRSFFEGGAKVIVQARMTTCPSANGASRASIIEASGPPIGCLHPVGTMYNELERTSNLTVLQLSWSDGTQSFYALDWLERCRYDSIFRADLRRSTEVRKDHAVRKCAALPAVDFELLLTDRDETTYHILQTIYTLGACMLMNVPRSLQGYEETVQAVGVTLAKELSHGNLYGSIFHVESSPNAKNIAYTSEALTPHHDLAYYTSMPGLQYLHAVNQKGVSGGESILVDALAAAYEFRNIVPDLFEILLECEVTFLKQRQDADIVYRRPHIDTDSDGSITAVHWSPPFEGPLCTDSLMIHDYFVARSAFERLVDDSIPRSSYLLPLPEGVERLLSDYAQEYTWQRKLAEGSMLIFNNQRMLHGRRGFTVADGTGNGRHLIGCYTDMDDTLNRYRILRRQRMSEKGHEAKFLLNTGNGSSGNL